MKIVHRTWRVAKHNPCEIEEIATMENGTVRVTPYASTMLKERASRIVHALNAVEAATRAYGKTDTEETAS